MSFKDVQALRKAERLEEAFAMAMNDYNQDSSNIWNKRSLFWVLYDYLKQAADAGNTSAFMEHLQQIADIDIVNNPEEGMSRTNLFRCIKALFKELGESRHNPDSLNEVAEQLFDFVKQIQMPIPSEEYSALLDAFLPADEKWHSFPDFIEWWNLDNFRPEDLKPRKVFNSNKTYMSLAESAHIAYAKALLRMNNIEKIKTFQVRLDKLSDNPNMPFIGYFNAKLLLALNSDSNDVLSEVLPFVRKKKNDYWVWQFLSEICKDDEECYLACLLRASHCKVKEEFLPKIRRALVFFYYERNDLSRMKYQLERYVRCRLESGYKIDYKIQSIINSVQLDPIQEDSSDPLEFMKITNNLIGVGTGEEKKIALRGVSREL